MNNMIFLNGLQLINGNKKSIYNEVAQKRFSKTLHIEKLPNI
jgi:hypothetical protein